MTGCGFTIRTWRIRSRRRCRRMLSIGWTIGSNQEGENEGARGRCSSEAEVSAKRGQRFADASSSEHLLLRCDLHLERIGPVFFIGVVVEVRPAGRPPVFAGDAANEIEGNFDLRLGRQA